MGNQNSETSTLKKYLRAYTQNRRYSDGLFPRPKISSQEDEKFLNEKSAVRILQESAPNLGGLISRPTNDPPDVEIQRPNGNLIGIEVTEFVNAESIKANIPYFQNPEQNPYKPTNFLTKEGKNFFQTRLPEIIETKTDKLKSVKSSSKYESLILLIASAEHMLTEDILQNLLKQKVWHSDVFNEIHFLLDYKPMLDSEGYHPCFRLDNTTNRNP